MKKSLGSALLVVGTTVGAGMLSLPLVTAACGFVTTVFLLILSWSVMYSTGIKLLLVCAKHSDGVNFTTLINQRMPRWMQFGFTLMYLLLLYALMSAFTTQGTVLIASLTANTFTGIPVNALIFLILFGIIIANYTMSDYINRFFLSIKFIFFLLSVIVMLAFFQYQYIRVQPLSFAAIIFAWPTLLPAFGFQNIVPVLYEYQKGDTTAVKRSILIGSLLVLFVYIIWVLMCLAILPQQGLNSYAAIFHEGNTLSTFLVNLTKATYSYSIKTFLTIFINISVLTSFICTGLSLLHYIKDSFKRFKISISTLTGLMCTFIPPYLFTIFYPTGFILALQFASIFAVVTLVYVPILLVDKGRLYTKQNIYPLVLGSLVIVAQILNLTGITMPFK